MAASKPNQHGYRAVSTKWSSGNLQWLDSSGNVIATFDAANRKLTIPSGAKFDASALKLGTGRIDLPLVSWRATATNDIPAKAVASGAGGSLAKDTTPILERINAATDKGLRIDWAANDVTEITQSFSYPDDADVTAAFTLNLLLYKSANVNTSFALTANYFEGIGGSDLGAALAALTATVLTKQTLAIGPTGLHAGSVASVSLTPAAHNSDAVYLMGSWLAYTRLTN